MGPEKHVFFKNVNLPALFSQLPKVDVTQILWEDCKNLHQMLQCENFSPTKVDHFEEKAKKWVRDFTAIY